MFDQPIRRRPRQLAVTWGVAALLAVTSAGFAGPEATSRQAATANAPAGQLFPAGNAGSPLELTLSAPWADLLTSLQNRDGNRGTSGQNRPADPRVVGHLSYLDPDSRATVDVGGVHIEVRGNTSRRTDECDFPKLSLDLPDARPDGRDDQPPSSLFAGIGSVKLGTHCGSRPDHELTRLGRWANEKAAFREALAYRLLDVAAVPVLRARPARVTYRSTDGTRDVFTQQALLLETDGAAARRSGNGTRIDGDAFASARDHFSEADTAQVHFAQAMIGNFDWCLRLTPDDTYRCAATHPLWNMLAIRHPPDHVPAAFPMLQDLDLAGIVVGRHPWFAEVFDRTAIGGDVSERELEVIAQLQHARAHFSRATLDATRTAFLARQTPILAAIATAAVDEHGRALAREYADAFFRHLTDDQFYRPVIARDGVLAYADAEGRQPVCAGAPIRPGTPVTVLATRGALTQVRALDAEWQWAPPRPCPAATHGPLWVGGAAISRDFPR